MSGDRAVLELQAPEQRTRCAFAPRRAAFAGWYNWEAFHDAVRGLNDVPLQNAAQVLYGIRLLDAMRRSATSGLPEAGALKAARRRLRRGARFVLVFVLVNPPKIHVSVLASATCPRLGCPLPSAARGAIAVRRRRRSTVKAWPGPRARRRTPRQAASPVKPGTEASLLAARPCRAGRRARAVWFLPAAGAMWQTSSVTVPAWTASAPWGEAMVCAGGLVDGQPTNRVRAHRRQDGQVSRRELAPLPEAVAGAARR